MRHGKFLERDLFPVIEPQENDLPEIKCLVDIYNLLDKDEHWPEKIYVKNTILMTRDAIDFAEKLKDSEFRKQLQEKFTASIGSALIPTTDIPKI